MVFCYKIITESPRQSGVVSPRKASPVGRLPVLPRTVSQLGDLVDYEGPGGGALGLDSIPERDWRLLAALARKREERDERDKLANQFRQMWQKEKEERKLMAAESSDQYNRFLHQKREQDRMWQEYKQVERMAEQQARQGQLVDCIRHKERRSQDLLAWISDKKASQLVDKAIIDEAKSILVTDRRTRLGQAEDWRKRVELVDGLRKVDDARKRRSEMLRDASQRVAISNALHTWESTLLRHEATALEMARRAGHAARAAGAAARAARLARAREARRRRARRLAALAARLRDAVREG